MKKHKSQIRVIRHAQKVLKPKPDCPQCGKGFMSEWEEFDVEYETYTRYRGCGCCGYWFDDKTGSAKSYQPRLTQSVNLHLVQQKELQMDIQYSEEVMGNKK